MILHVVGTRPNLIKCSELVPHITGEQVVIFTQQHWGDMSEPFEKTLDTKTISHTENVGEMAKILCGMDDLKEADKIVVYGDCRSSLAGALAAYEFRKPLVHVEAGLRCGNLLMMEERARIAIDGQSQMNFCPSKRELLNVHHGFVVGDIMYDTFLREKKDVDSVGHDHFILLTLHRRELIYGKIFEVLKKIVQKFKGQEILWPIHPHTKKIVKMYPGITLLGPANHMQLLSYLKHAEAVVTDSGGVSKEATWFKKKLYIVRDVSEWGLPTIGEDAHGITEEPKEGTLDSGNGHAAENMARLL